HCEGSGQTLAARVVRNGGDRRRRAGPGHLPGEVLGGEVGEHAGGRELEGRPIGDGRLGRRDFDRSDGGRGDRQVRRAGLAAEGRRDADRARRHARGQAVALGGVRNGGDQVIRGGPGGLSGEVLVGAVGENPQCGEPDGGPGGDGGRRGGNPDHVERGGGHGQVRRAGLAVEGRRDRRRAQAGARGQPLASGGV